MNFFDDSLITFRGDLIDFFTSNIKSSTSRVLCTNCGHELSTYAETGRLGCSKCYDVFGKEIKAQLRKWESQS